MLEGNAVQVTGNMILDGPLVRYQRHQPATVTSVFGRLAYERAYYAGCWRGKGKAPVDEQYGL